MSRSLVLFVLLATSGCSARSTIPVVASDAPPPATATLPPAIHWSRNSAEHSAIFLQTYRLAGERLREMASGRAAGSWTVILDADETVLDNSTYQKERAASGQGYTSESWDAWVHRVEAGALPGAARFIATVRSLGGVVAIVTNRVEDVCPETRQNLSRLGMTVDVVMCRPPDTSDKNGRFQRVRSGNAVPGIPPLEILMWVGDNIQDFPDLRQDIRMLTDTSFADFGSRFIVLPNPMYGSWEGNPAR